MNALNTMSTSNSKFNDGGAIAGLGHVMSNNCKARNISATVSAARDPVALADHLAAATVSA